MTSAAERRRLEILTLIQDTGGGRVDELAEAFGVTASTIRRDLAVLRERGSLARTLGGAVGITSKLETSQQQRATVAHRQKGAIARWAAAQVQPGEDLLLDAGSTVAALAREIRHIPDLRVTTPGLVTLDILTDAEHLEVHSLGGRVRPVSRSLVGAAAAHSLERSTFDRAFLGADGVVADRGLCEADEEQTYLKELMARRSAAVYILAHAAKLGSAPFNAWAPLALPWTLVTDANATAQQLDPFRTAGVDVVVVPVSSPSR